MAADSSQTRTPLAAVLRWGSTAYGAAIRLAAGLGNGKARRWLAMRREAALRLAAWQSGGVTVWMHCASLGEFEQGRPVLEAIRTAHPHVRLVLTFFSPSGYDLRRDWPGADLVVALPEDAGAAPTRFLEQVRPTLALFVKYDLWPGYVQALAEQHIPLVLFSGRYASFPTWERPLHQALLGRLSHLFVQDEASAQVVRTELGLKAVSVAGDTRFDRVATIAAAWEPLPDVEAYVAGRPCLVAGSTWPADEAMLLPLMEAETNGCLIVVPHELHESHLASLTELPYAIRWSQRDRLDPRQHRILVVDQMGLLSRLYQYADAVWIGGGFGKGIHNTLEAAVYGKSLAFGPRYQRFREAIDLIAQGAAVVVDTPVELGIWWQRVLRRDPAVAVAGEAARAYVQSQVGATSQIVAHLAPYLKPLQP